MMLLFWLYILPLGVSIIPCIIFIWDGYVKKGYIQGDDAGMLVASIVPLMNIIVALIIIYVLTNEFFSAEKRYFMRNKR